MSGNAVRWFGGRAVGEVGFLAVEGSELAPIAIRLEERWAETEAHCSALVLWS